MLALSISIALALFFFLALSVLALKRFGEREVKRRLDTFRDETEEEEEETGESGAFMAVPKRWCARPEGQDAENPGKAVPSGRSRRKKPNNRRTCPGGCRSGDTVILLQRSGAQAAVTGKDSVAVGGVRHGEGRHRLSSKKRRNCSCTSSAQGQARVPGCSRASGHCCAWLNTWRVTDRPAASSRAA